MLAGSSQYGAWSAAPREPSAPSAMSFTAPTNTRPSPGRVGPLVERRLPGGGVGASERDVIPERERAGGGEPAVGGEGVEVGAHLVDAGEPDGETVGDRRADRVLDLRRARARLDPPDELLGGVDEDAGRLAGGVALDAGRRAGRACVGRSRRSGAPPCSPRSRGRRRGPGPRGDAARRGRATRASGSGRPASDSGPTRAR